MWYVRATQGGVGYTSVGMSECGPTTIGVCTGVHIAGAVGSYMHSSACSVATELTAILLVWRRFNNEWGPTLAQHSWHTVKNVHIYTHSCALYMGVEQKLFRSPSSSRLRGDQVCVHSFQTAGPGAT